MAARLQNRVYIIFVGMNILKTLQRLVTTTKSFLGNKLS